MRKRVSTFTPEEAREVLTDFVTHTEQVGEVWSYGELKSIVNPRVTGALTDLILQTGRPSRRLTTPNAATLEQWQDRRLISGKVEQYSIGNQSQYFVGVTGYTRGSFAFRPKPQSMFYMAAEGLQQSAMASEEAHIHRPYTTSPAYVEEFETAPLLHSEGGGAAVMEATRPVTHDATDTLNGFLHITAQLTKELLAINPQ